MTSANTPNLDPSALVPEFQLSKDQLRDAITFTDGLADFAGRYSHDPVKDARETAEEFNTKAQFQDKLEHQLGIAIKQGLSDGDPSELALELVISAESLGATRDETRANGLTNLLENNPLLSPSDASSLLDIYRAASESRRNKVPNAEVTMKIAEDVNTILGQVRQMEEQGAPENPALKVGLLAYLAGTTLMYPGFDAPNQLAQELRGHVLAETH